MGEDPRTAGTAVTGSGDPAVTGAGDPALTGSNDQAVTGGSDQAVTPTSDRPVTSGDPEEIRREIEATREELGDTVAALAAKADVKSQAKQKLQDTRAAVTGKKDELMGKAKQASPQTASSAATSMSQKARENPVPVTAAGAFVFGFVAGWVMRR